MLYTPAFASLFAANLSLVASFAAFFLFPLFITDHGGSQRDIGIIMGCFALASALCRPWVSEMIDRFGRKRSYSLGCTIMTLMPLLHLFFSGPLTSFYLPLLLLRAVHGIGLAICFTAVFTFIVDLIPEGRLNEGIGMFGTSGLIGLAVGPMIAEPVLSNFGYNAYFLTAAGLAGFGLLVHLPLRDPHHGRQHADSPAVSFFALLKQRKLLVSACLALVFGFGLAATGNFIAPLAQDRQLELISLFYLSYSCAAVGIRFFSGRLADRIGEQQIIPWGFYLAAGGLIVVPFVGNDLLLGVCGFIFGIGHGLLFPAINSMAIRDEPYSVRGKVTGIFTGGIDSGSFVGALILGQLGDLFGYTVLFFCAATIVLSGRWIFSYRPDNSPA
ncbi:Predicted arabinose efflux permease, MFS family [Malonomonas rubra DSM 5091]|uniref:Predicted arabinose efflux permease, MFS family n=1 Tax=Malonomonas rubra DSM 5091 TaxID=1122189 RepID=A0A1M6HK53_MALRU|nr:MFS transporter [Malonomonas rubra]SHJ22551.1 Predicted arabinose efflux permease, MFS family [Malonomonas rubra DSM 5091]